LLLFGGGQGLPRTRLHHFPALGKYTGNFSLFQEIASTVSRQLPVIQGFLTGSDKPEEINREREKTASIGSSIPPQKYHHEQAVLNRRERIKLEILTMMRQHHYDNRARKLNLLAEVSLYIRPKSAKKVLKTYNWELSTHNALRHMSPCVIVYP